MKVAIVDRYYPSFLSSHYAEHPDISDRSYDVQWKTLMAARFGTSDAYSHFLRERGHEGHELIVNCAELRSAWQQQYGGWRMRRRAPEPRRILDAQLRWLEPDVVYVQDVHTFDSDELEAIRRTTGALIVGQVATELPEPTRLRRYDLLVSSFPHYVDAFRSRGIDSESLLIGFDPRVLAELERGPAYALADVVFVGALSTIQHAEATRILESAAPRLPIVFYGPGIEEWGLSSPLRRQHRGDAWGLDMYRRLRSARISLNRHGAVAGAFANNMRLYEATGVGSLLLTDARRNLQELFDVGTEVVAYHDADELVEQACSLLADEVRRAEIASAGQQRTLKDHTYAVRMRQLADMLEARI